MRKNQEKLVAVGMLVLALVTGCGSNNNHANDNHEDETSNSILSTEMEDVEHHAGEKDSQADTKAEQAEESSKADAGAEQTEESSKADTGAEQAEESSKPQSGTTEAAENTEDIEEELAAYRAEREKGISSIGNYTLMQLPNEENYNYGVGDISYVSRFDSRELHEAFKAADAYVKGTLNLENEAWICIDPRMTAIYEDDDKGVANGYDADNIFICEYNDNGNWQNFILFSEGKCSDLEALHH